MKKSVTTVATYLQTYSLVLRSMKKSIKDGTYNGTSIDEFYQTLVEARVTQLEKEGGYPRPKAEDIYNRKKKLAWQHIHFIRMHQLLMPFNEFVAFHAYVCACIISSFYKTNGIKTMNEYFQQWLEWERDIFYKESNREKMTVDEMKGLYITSILNDGKFEEAA